MKFECTKNGTSRCVLYEILDVFFFLIRHLKHYSNAAYENWWFTDKTYGKRTGKKNIFINAAKATFWKILNLCCGKKMQKHISECKSRKMKGPSINVRWDFSYRCFWRIFKNAYELWPSFAAGVTSAFVKRKRRDIFIDWNKLSSTYLKKTLRWV